MYPTLTLHPYFLALLVVSISSTTILTALLLTHYSKRGFRIHPYPYLSDAGLHDPERVVINIGLSLSATLFLPVAIGLYLFQTAYLSQQRVTHGTPALSLSLRDGKATRRRALLPASISCDPVPRLGFYAGVNLALFLALFTGIPGWFYLHHIFALVFAVSAALWCFCHAVFTHARAQREARERGGTVLGRVRVMYVLIGIEAAVVAGFGVIWTSVKLQIPFKMIPNKDPRFVMLAFLEYVGTGSFLGFIAMVAAELKKERINLSLMKKFEPGEEESGGKTVEV